MTEKEQDAARKAVEAEQEEAAMKVMKAELATAHESGNNVRYQHVAGLVHEASMTDEDREKAEEFRVQVEKNEAKAEEDEEDEPEEGEPVSQPRSVTGRFTAHE